ncbi:hypothetical protein E0E62_17370 [Streptomyces sp. 16-176A]
MGRVDVPSLEGCGELWLGVGAPAPREGVPLRPPVPPLRHDCPQLRGERRGRPAATAPVTARLAAATTAWGGRPTLGEAAAWRWSYCVTVKLPRMAEAKSWSPSVLTRSATASGVVRPQARRT